MGLYNGVTVFLLCYSVISPSSFESILNTAVRNSELTFNFLSLMKGAGKKWFKEITENCPKALIVLVATKVDLRDDKETIELLKIKNLKTITYPQR
jgi:Ras-related C3 botulinum toxin substrate 1